MIDETENPLLEFLRTRPKAVGESFRTNPRYVSRHRAELSWDDQIRSKKVRTRLIDISRAGAALRSSEPPPVNTRVRLRLVGSDSTPWIEAVVLGVERLDEKSHRVRLLFRDPCPTVFLKTAVLNASSAAAEAPVPALENAL